MQPAGVADQRSTSPRQPARAGDGRPRPAVDHFSLVVAKSSQEPQNRRERNRNVRGMALTRDAVSVRGIPGCYRTECANNLYPDWTGGRSFNALSSPRPGCLHLGPRYLWSLPFPTPMTATSPTAAASACTDPSGCAGRCRSAPVFRHEDTSPDCRQTFKVCRL